MKKEYWYEKEIDGMLLEISKVKTKKELAEILDQILTPREINDMARRLAILKMLKAGTTYKEIAEKYNASPNIIAKLSHKIGYGFRRSSNIQLGKTQKKKQAKKPTLRYKGAVPIHKLFS